MITLRKLTMDDAEMIRSWRNSPEVADFMYRNDPISIEEHQKWMSHILSSPDSTFCRIIENDGQPIGLMSLSSISTRHHSCEWGGYLAPDAAKGIGSGKAVILESLRVAFVDLNLNRVVVEVLTDNSRAISLYESVGFVREGLLRQRAWHGSEPKDAFIYSILKSDWENNVING